MDRGFEFTVSLVPPSVNHYVKHARSGVHYVTKEAKAFKWAVALAAREAGVEPINAKRYSVAFEVLLGKGQKGDADNFSKVILDSLTDARLIVSDARVVNLSAKKSRDWNNPRTVISVLALS